MATKYLKYYTVNLEEKVFPKKLFKQIHTYISNISLYWGGEYVIFVYNNESKYFQPFEGSPILLGYDEKFLVPIKNYSVTELSSFIEDRSPTSIILKLKDSYEISEGVYPIKTVIQVPEGTFTSIKTVSLIDYSETITELEKSNLLTTHISKNILATDQRTFTLKESAIKLLPKLKNYVNESYEVDTLGSSFLKDLTLCIKELYYKIKR